MTKKDLWNGKQYKENSSPQENSATDIINSISFHEGAEILDVGCGDGKVTQKFCSLVPKGHVYGLDPSASMVEEAKQVTSHRDNISFFEGSAENFKSTKKFDYIFSFHSLHWVKDKTQMFQNISEHLKPNGKFIFVTAGGENPNIAKVFSSKKWQDKIGSHGKKFHAADKDKVTKMMLDTGLCVESSKAEYWSSFYDKSYDLINWLMTWVPYATGLNPEDSLSFTQEIVQNLTNQSINDGIIDKIELKTEMLIVTACKEKLA